MITSSSLFEHLDYILRASNGCEGVTALWIKVERDREEFRRSITERYQSHPVFPIVVRLGDVFKSPDAVVPDFFALLETARVEFDDRRFEQITASRNMIVVLLSYINFPIPQTSSMCVCPPWVPYFGGRQFFLSIEDVTFKVAVRLDFFAAESAALARSLYRLESAIVDVALITIQAEVNCADELASAFFDSKNRELNLEDKRRRYVNLLESSRATLNKVTDPVSYRAPTGERGEAIVGQIHYAWCRTAPDSIHRLSMHLHKALGLHKRGREITPSDSLMGIVWRPATPKLHTLSSEVRFCRSLIVNSVAAIQFLSASHHAGEYQPLAGILQKSFLQELASVLDSAGDTLRN